MTQLPERHQGFPPESERPPQAPEHHPDPAAPEQRAPAQQAPAQHPQGHRSPGPGEVGQSELDLGVVSTGSPEVDRALTPIEGLGDLAVSDHPELFEGVLTELASAMNESAADHASADRRPADRRPADERPVEGSARDT